MPLDKRSNQRTHTYIHRRCVVSQLRRLFGTLWCTSLSSASWFEKNVYYICTLADVQLRKWATIHIHTWVLEFLTIQVFVFATINICIILCVQLIMLSNPMTLSIEYNFRRNLHKEKSFKNGHTMLATPTLQLWYLFGSFWRKYQQFSHAGPTIWYPTALQYNGSPLI